MSEIKTNTPFRAKIIFWAVLSAIGLAAILTGAILMGAYNAPTMLWLPTALGIVLFAIGITLVVYLIVIEHKRKIVRSRGI